MASTVLSSNECESKTIASTREFLLLVGLIAKRTKFKKIKARMVFSMNILALFDYGFNVIPTLG
jgi:hypothetical protein